MFKNKKVIITGANRGIGKSILKKFSKNRATIFSCTRKKDKDFIDYCKALESQNKCKIINIYFEEINYFTLFAEESLIINFVFNFILSILFFLIFIFSNNNSIDFSPIRKRGWYIVDSGG